MNLQQLAYFREAVSDLRLLVVRWDVGRACAHATVDAGERGVRRQEAPRSARSAFAAQGMGDA
jgi:hypothetical protein